MPALREVKAHRRAILILVLLSAAIFANTFRNEFVLDDNLLIVEDQSIRDPLTCLRNLEYLRCVNTITFMIDYSIWGLNPFGFHLTNLILHVLCVIGLYALVIMVFGNRRIAFLTALLFAVHPVHTGAVTAIAHRKELLAMLFFVLAFMTYMRKHRSYWFFVCSVAFFFLALLSKESAVISLPLMFLLYDIYFSPGGAQAIRRNAKYYLLSLAVVGAFLIPGGYRLLHSRLSDAGMLRATGGETDSYLLVLATAFRGILRYVRLLVVPLGLSADHFFPVSKSILEAPVIASMALTASLAVLSARVYKYSKEVSFGTLWFLISIIPPSNIIPMSTFFVADRYLYVPSAGFCLVLAAVLDKLYRLNPKVLPGRLWRTIGLALTIAIIASYSVLTVLRNAEWRSGFTLWSKTVRQNPESVIAHANLGLAYLERDMHREAVTELERALEISPNYPDAYINLGNAYLEMGNLDKAIGYYQRAIKIDPAAPVAHLDLGIVYFRKGLYDLSIVELRKALELEPGNAAAHFNLGAAYLEQGDLDEALVALTRASQVNPLHAPTRNNLGVVYLKRGLLDEAIREFKEALRIDPEYVSARFNLGFAYALAGSPDLAIPELERSLELDPGNAAARFNLGTTYLAVGAVDEAIGEFTKALEINPNHALTHSNLGVAYFEKGLFDEAIVEFKRSLALLPDDISARFNLGKAYMGKGLMDEAIAEFEAVLERAPQVTDARYELARCYLKTGKIAEARIEIGKALGTAPDAPQVLDVIESMR